MLKSFAKFAVNRPVAIIVFFLLISTLGVFSWNKLPVELFPNLQSPSIMVSIKSGDRPTEQMEVLYGEKLEQVLFSVPGIESIEQVVRQGEVVCKINFDWDTDIDFALIDVNRSLSSIASDPKVDEIHVSRFNASQLPIMVLGLEGKNDLGLGELRDIAKRQIAPRLEQLSGVAEARISGGRVKEVQLHVNEDRLRAYGITIAEVRDKIQENNLDFNAGTIEENNQSYVVRGRSRFLSLNDIENTVVRYLISENSITSAIRLSDIAEVKMGDADFDSLVRINGREGVGISVYKESGANTIATSKYVNNAVKHINEQLTSISISVVKDDASFVQGAISNLKGAALSGILLSVIILIYFLRSLRPFVVIALAVPISLLATVFLLDASGHTLNLMTLGGLALGAGMLVDNAIVVIESIFRHRLQGDDAKQAATNGVGMIGSAILAGTLSTCIVFLPIIFLQGMAVKLFYGIAITVIISLLASLVVAIVLIPSLAALMLRKPLVTNQSQGRLPNVTAILSFCLKHSGKVLFTSLVLVVFSVIALLNLGTQLQPPNDPTQFSVKIVTPPGQNVSSTNYYVDQIESLIKISANGNVSNILSEVGDLNQDFRNIQQEFSAENTAEIRVKLKHSELTRQKIAESTSREIKKLYGVEADWRFNDSSLTTELGLAEKPITVEVYGQSLEGLRNVTNELTNRLNQLKALWNVSNSFEGAAPELRIKFNDPVLQALGIDKDSVLSNIKAALDGLPVTSMAIGDETREVVLYLPELVRKDVEDLTFLAFNGQLIGIKDVASFEEVPGAREIYRNNQKRLAKIYMSVSSDYKYKDAIEQIIEAIETAVIPVDYSVKLAGDESQRKQTFNELTWAGIIAVMLVFMVLASTFESLWMPLVCVISIPISLIGVAIALVPIGEPLAVMAILGVVILAGVAVNNSILLVQTIQNQILDGSEPISAITQSIAIRLRPIIMTTATTFLALIPLAISGGEGAELRAQLAWTVMGGIVFSTLGCILVTPCLFLKILKWNSSDNSLLADANEPA